VGNIVYGFVPPLRVGHAQGKPLVVYGNFRNLRAVKGQEHAARHHLRGYTVKRGHQRVNYDFGLGIAPVDGRVNADNIGVAVH
jgi:hypothetical protein